MLKKYLVMAAFVAGLSGCVSMEQRQTELWAPVAGPNVADAKLGVFHAPLKKVFQAALDVLDDKNVPIGSQGTDYIKTGHFSAAAGMVTEAMSANFAEDTAAGTVTVKWRTFVVTQQSGFGAASENQESAMGDTPEQKLQYAQEWFVAIYKKLNK